MSTLNSGLGSSKLEGKADLVVVLGWVLMELSPMAEASKHLLVAWTSPLGVETNPSTV